MPSSMAGRQGKCASCGKLIKIPTPPVPAIVPSVADEIVQDPMQQVLVLCRVCQTRMYAFAKDIGRKLKCPDCGALSAVPPPPKLVAKKQPKALEGEQYEVWSADDAPLPSEIAKQQQKLAPVSCWLCNTLMYAREDQIGQELVCPDCGSRSRVLPPGKQESTPFALKQGYAVLPTSGPREAPQVIDPEVHRKIYEKERQRLDPNLAIDGKKRKRRILVDEFGRPVPPRWPLVRGVWTFPFYSSTITQWVALAGGLILCLMLLEGAVSIITGGIGGMDGGGAISSMCFLAAGSILLCLWFFIASACWLTILTDSSEGLDVIERWPSFNPTEHIMDSFYILMPGVISALPGWAISALPGLNLLPAPLFVAGSVLLFFPVFLLSTLDESSPVGIFSAKVLKSFFHLPGSAILLFVESILLAGVALTPLVAAEMHSDLWYWALPVLGMAVSFAYFRLLGRYGWCLGQATAVDFRYESSDKLAGDQEK